MMGQRSQRSLGPGLASVIVAGNVIGGAIFALPATLGAIGSVSIIGWLIATLGAFTMAGVIAFLAGATGDRDGLVGYVNTGLSPFWGFLTALFYWMSGFAANISIAVAVAGYLTVFVPGLSSPVMRSAAAIVALWAATGLNLAGARSVGGFGVVSLISGLLPLLLLATLGWASFEPHMFAASWNVTGSSDASAIKSSVVGAFFAFTGFETGAAISAVVRDPKRNVPIATVAGTSLAAVVYILVSVVLMGLAPARDYAVSSAPLALAVARVGGPALAGAVAICALLKASGTLCGITLSTAQTARAGFDAYSKGVTTAPSDAVPRRILIWTAVAASLVAAISTSPTFAKQYDALIDVSTLWTIVPYILCAAALLRLLQLITGTRQRVFAVVASLIGIVISTGTLASGAGLSLMLTLGLAVVVVVLWWGGVRRTRRATGVTPQ
jgi:arginine:agmatine antiporter